MRSLRAILALAVAALIGAVPSAAGPDDGFCIDCLSVRLERPVVVRGPFADELDNQFSVIPLKDGGFRGFSANAATFAIDGAQPWSMGAERRRVLRKGPKGSASDCGRWLNAAMRADGLTYGFVHQEHGCDYRAGQTDKSMGLAVSADEGLTWTDLGTVISGRDSATKGKITGEGDCSWVDGQDGYLYAYCLRNSDWRTIVARAPVSDPGPGNWRKYHVASWGEPGLGGAGTALENTGITSAYLKTLNRVATIANDRRFGGLRLSLSADKVTFTNLDEPILTVDREEWRRPADTDLIAYISMINPEDGSNVVGAEFLIAYVYLPPGESFASRYLVFQKARISMGDRPPPAQAGIALSRWKTAAGAYRTSSGPVVDASYRYDKPLGYLLTRQRQDAATNKLAECIGEAGDRAHYSLAIDGNCAGEGFRRLRTAGFVYTDPRPDTVPLYRCLDVSERIHFTSNQSDCEGQGAKQALLGYALHR
jgi:hypothetical protein